MEIPCGQISGKIGYQTQ